MPPSSRPVEDPTKVKLIDGRVTNLRRFAQPDDKTWSLFNPSICENAHGEYAMSFRSSNYVILDTGELYVTNGGKIRNQVWFCDMDADMRMQNLRRIHVSKDVMDTTRGLEDPKLFWRDGLWHFTATLLEEHTPVARMALCTLDAAAREVTDIEVLGGWEVRKPEKNWMLPTLMESTHFDFVYGPNAIVTGEQIIFTMTEDPRYTGLRGSSHLVQQDDGTYLAVMHKFWASTQPVYLPDRFMAVTAKDKNYVHYLVRVSAYGDILEMSVPFQFVSRGIEFAAGLAEVGDDLVISFGKADVASHLCIIPKDRALKMLNPLRQ
jgi:hypothetical protein